MLITESRRYSYVQEEFAAEEFGQDTLLNGEASCFWEIVGDRWAFATGRFVWCNGKIRRFDVYKIEHFLGDYALKIKS